MKTFNEFVDDMNAINVGDKVAYSATFLKSTAQHTGPIPFARGVVDAISNYGVAVVNWDTPEAPEKVHVKNLVKVDRMHFEPN